MKTIYKIIAAILIVSLIIAVSGLLISQYIISNEGKVKSVNIKVSVNHISWGLISPNETKTENFTVINDGTTPLKTSMAVGNWTPVEAANYFNCTWNKEGTILQPDESMDVEVYLYLMDNVSGIKDFSFDITIIGEET